MWKTKKSTWIVGAVVLVAFFAYYQFAKDTFRVGTRSEEETPAFKKAEEVATGWREVSAVTSYDTPNDGRDTLRFVVTLDQQGTIQGIKTLDAETNTIAEKKVEFSEQLTVILKGKKLSELQNIDKVGKSSLTTTAFNSALADLKAAL